MIMEKKMETTIMGCGFSRVANLPLPNTIKGSTAQEVLPMKPIILLTGSW